MGTRRVVADALRLTRLVRKDPGLALLRADLGPMAAAILAEHLGGEVRRRPVAELHELVDEDLAALRDAGAVSESGEPVRTLIVTTFGRPGYVRRALEAGASGFVVKDTGARQLAEAIRRVHAGLRVVDPSLAADSLVTGASPLTEREAQVLREAASGGTAQQIASALFLSAGTVRNYLSAAMAKTGASTRQDAVRIATENGWL